MAQLAITIWLPSSHTNDIHKVHQPMAQQFFFFLSKSNISSPNAGDGSLSVCDTDSLVSEDLPDELALAWADVPAADLAVADEEEGGNLHDVHVPEEPHAAVVLIPVHPGEHDRVGHLPRELDDGGVDLDTGAAVLQTHVEDDELVVGLVVLYQLLHVLPRVQLLHRRVAVPVVQHVPHQLVRSDRCMIRFKQIQGEITSYFMIYYLPNIMNATRRQQSWINCV